MRDVARAIVDDNLYMVLATADADGRPWASPVHFAHEAYRRFIWVSAPDSTHSCNIAVRPECSIVIFDSRVPVNSGQAVYMSVTAKEVTGDEHEELLKTFSDRSKAARPSALLRRHVQRRGLARLGGINTPRLLE